MPAARKTAAKTVEKPEEPEAPETPAEEETPEPVTVTDPEEMALLINARRLREAAQGEPSEPGPTAVENTAEQVLLEDERSQRELDLRVVNQQLLGARQALSAAKLNRLLNAAGLLPPEAKQHENQFRQDIHEIRQGIDLMVAIKAAMGPHGIDEPSLVAIEVPTDGLASLAK